MVVGGGLHRSGDDTTRSCCAVAGATDLDALSFTLCLVHLLRATRLSKRLNLKSRCTHRHTHKGSSSSSNSSNNTKEKSVHTKRG